MENTFIEWEKIGFKRHSGTEKVKCPNCNARRTDKTDRSLSVNHTKGVAKCHYCGAVSFREKTEPKYTPINQKAFKRVLSEEKALAYILGRGISETTVSRLGVTFERYYQPGLRGEVDNIVFNYFEGKKIVNKKFRSANKYFTQVKGGKPILYNINAAKGRDTIYIVEGEFDVLAMVEAGYYGTISVPNGANNNDDFWLNSQPYLKHVKTFVIATDCDSKGIALRELIAQRLGRYRCKYVEFNGKDANDDLLSGHLKTSIENAKVWPVAGTYTAKDLRAETQELYEHGFPDTLYPKGSWFGTFKNKFKVMRGQLVIGTGIPSHGKSTFTDWYVLNLVKDWDLKASWYTPEHYPLPMYNAELMRKVIGKPFHKTASGDRMSLNEMNMFDAWASERVYLTECGEKETPTWDWLLTKFTEQMFTYGIDIFVIDAFNKIMLPSGNKLDEINKVLTRLTHFCKVNNVVVFLIAHPTKMQRVKDSEQYQKPSLYDVSGSADFRNQVHCGYVIHREEDFTTFTNLKTKWAHQGQLSAMVDFKYIMANGRLVSLETENPNFNLINVTDEDVKKWQPEPIDYYDTDREDLPF